MAKRTAVIDIGSNSVRLVIFERTSRFAFHLLHEAKSRVRISENAYDNEGNLQKVPLQRAFSALKDFNNMIRQYKVNKTLCVATSALRDAPNKKEFIQKVQKELSLNIKVIEGEREAYLGGIAAANLLYLNTALTIDIGGGSTEFAFYQDKQVQQTFSLNLGTVRLKELYFDNDDIIGAKEYIQKELQKLPSNLHCDNLIGIGGTLRAISKMIMEKDQVSFQKLHGFAYQVTKQKNYFQKIQASNEKELLALGVKKDRLDVLQAGLLILSSVIESMEVKQIITSGVGVREGLFLSDLLRSQHDRFPNNYNPSVKSLLDRFSQDKGSYLVEESSKLFDLMADKLELDAIYKKTFILAIKLSQIGKELDFYESHRHAYYILLNGLNYGFSHEETVLIACLVRYQRKKQPNKAHLQKYQDYLPKTKITNALGFLMRLSLDLFNDFRHQEGFELKLEKDTLKIKAKDAYLLKEKINDLYNNDFIKLKLL